MAATPHGRVTCESDSIFMMSLLDSKNIVDRIFHCCDGSPAWSGFEAAFLQIIILPSVP